MGFSERFAFKHIVGLKAETLRWLNELPPIDNWLKNRATEVIEQTNLNEYLKADGLYLDIGCGKGHIMEALEKMNAESKPLQWMGVDVYDYPTSKVRNRIAETREEIIEPKLRAKERILNKPVPRLDFGAKAPQTFAFAEAEHLPFKESVMDGASFFYVLHHMDIDQQKRALLEAGRLIKEDGYLFITEDVVESTDENQRKTTERIDRLLNVEGKEEPHNYRSDKEWQTIFQELGLEIVSANQYSSGQGKNQVQHASYTLRKAKDQMQVAV